jgi:hypothetical protein
MIQIAIDSNLGHPHNACTTLRGAGCAPSHTATAAATRALYFCLQASWVSRVCACKFRHMWSALYYLALIGCAATLCWACPNNLHAHTQRHVQHTTSQGIRTVFQCRVEQAARCAPGPACTHNATYSTTQRFGTAIQC